jgi:hypothetical protein
MRNLKKFLALALAVMMTFSLMVTANAITTDADVTDRDSITDEFKEAVAVLNGLKIITGYEDDTFRPDKNISRQEATALVYRLHSGDADNVKNNLYSTADNIAKFKDVNPNGAQQWSAGYIGYCANQEIIKGVSADRFNPTGNVTGYQMLAMVLRAIGYGQRGEYEGTGWQTRVATTATQLGMLKNIDDTNYAGTLSAPATRELVAEIVFQAALQKQVIWTEAFGYVSKNQITGVELLSLGEQKFDLDYTAYTTVDEWGRPGYYWFQDKKNDGKAVTSGSGKNVVATITPTPEKTYTTTTRECDLAHDLDISKSATFELYVNDEEPITQNYLVVATDTATKVGGQGRLTEVYRNLRNDKGSVADRVIMVDTFLAKVTGVTTAVKDAAGHLITPAKLTLDVYDQSQNGTKNPNPSSPRVIFKDDGTNWEYSMGDMILLNAWTDHDGDQTHAAGSKPQAITSVNLHTNANAEKAAFEPEQVELVGSAPLKETNANYEQETEINYAEILGVAKSTVAKQSVVYWNSEKHDVGGTEHPDQLDLFLNVAGTTTNTDFTWYFDQYDNVIGIGEAVKSNYGVITSIYSSFSTADGATDGKAVAKAHVKYADGTEGDIVIDRFIVNGTGTLNQGHVQPDTKMTAASGSTELIPVYDYSVTATNAMIAVEHPGSYTKPANVADDGQLLVAPVASINKNVEGAQNTVTTPAPSSYSTFFGIIEQNLFKFIASGDGSVTALEVAGRTLDNGETAAANGNDDMYVNHYNVLVDVKVSDGQGNTVAADATLKKNVGVVTLDDANGSRTNPVTLRLNNSTQIMLKEGNNVNTYNGLSALGGDVDFTKATEVDWVDYNNDGIVDVLYATATVKGNVSYGLFYYNGGAAQWNGVDKKGTLAGYLNGEAATLTFDDQDEFNAVLNSVATYGGHLFAVQITNGEVTNLMVANNSNSNDERIIKTVGVANAVAFPVADTVNLSATAKLTWTTGDPSFPNTPADGNPYTATSKALWFQDDNAAAATTAIYDAAAGIVRLNTDEFILTEASKKIGSDLSYLNLGNRTNDITIIYDVVSGKNIITEIYVTTQPDNTPGTSGAGTPGAGTTQVPAAYDNATKLGNYLRNFTSGVFTSSDAKLASSANNTELLYFPFSVTGTATCTLVITDASGVEVYRESEGGVAAGNKIFYMDLTGTHCKGVWSNGYTMLTPGTYNYEVLVNGVSVNGINSFTMD